MAWQMIESMWFAYFVGAASGMALALIICGIGK